MDNVISAQELKRRGISAVDTALRNGPVHVIRRNRPSYVILSEEGYQALAEANKASQQLWDRVLAKAPTGQRGADEISAQVDTERGDWE